MPRKQESRQKENPSCVGVRGDEKSQQRPDQKRVSSSARLQRQRQNPPDLCQLSSQWVPYCHPITVIRLPQTATVAVCLAGCLLPAERHLPHAARLALVRRERIGRGCCYKKAPMQRKLLQVSSSEHMCTHTDHVHPTSKMTGQKTSPNTRHTTFQTLVG